MEHLPGTAEAADNNFLAEGQNIFDQEPFSTIMEDALRVIKSPYIPHDRQRAERISARAMLIALAKEPRQDVKYVEIAPMLAGLDQSDRMNISSAYGAHDTARKLLQALIWETNKYPGWAEYLLENRDKILTSGEPRKFKEARPITRFEAWTPSPEPGTY